ncbi:hypothetical protein DOM22_13295 [Bdellovibrio sp. ZAP7]|uniref:hypothetical protein n=1 Tax=Bdellovibrio sp. ZAP7 TaxID=2231053 RepID=UPI00115C43C6|nr:hypothetical protein [Bdellovibrio sp. ZAP7]QDK46062.1 hypothetical protein DOM22_13295 [Bdellovibrio sp. ZAP7]
MRSLIALLMMLLACQSHARSEWDREFITAEIGSRSVPRYGLIPRFLPSELSDWTDPASMTTSRLSNQCGILSEAKIVGGSRFNFLFLGIVNSSSKVVRVERNRISAAFSGGRERIMMEATERTFSEVQSNWYSWGFIAFPSKWDFKDQDEVKVSVPVSVGGAEECNLEFIFERNKLAAKDPDTYSEAPASVYSLSYLVSVGITPVAATTFNNSKPDGFAFYSANFFRVSEGSFFNFDAQNLGDVHPSDYFNANTFKSAWLWTLSAGPVWRSLYSNSLTGFINVGPSLGYVRAQAFEDKDETFRLSPGVYASYSLDWCFVKGSAYKDEGDHSLGITVFAKYYPWLFDGSRTDYGLIGVSFDLFRGGQ